MPCGTEQKVNHVFHDVDSVASAGSASIGARSSEVGSTRRGGSDISDEGSESDEDAAAEQNRTTLDASDSVIIVSHRLPVVLTKTEDEYVGCWRGWL